MPRNPRVRDGNTNAHPDEGVGVQVMSDRETEGAELDLEPRDVAAWFQIAKPRARIMSRPSSVIRSGPHGGIHTQLMRKRSTTLSRA